MNGQHTDQSKPAMAIPRVYNAAHDLLSRHSQRPNKIAYIEASTNKKLSYGELSHQAHCFAQSLIDTGFEQEQRVLLCMHDGLHWPVVFLGCILAGVVPIAVNTLLTTKDYEYMLRDSRAKGLIVSSALWPQFENILPLVTTCQHVFIDEDAPARPSQSISQLIRNSQPLSECVHTLSDDVCFWLYSSGSTGSPKGTLHLHSHIIQTAELYGRGVLGLQENDVVFSAAKLFFAYGLGNALSFPLAQGATTVLFDKRATPADVFDILQTHQPTVFYGVPTLFASMLAQASRPKAQALN